MRLEIVFKTPESSIPIDYQYQLCSFVYKRLRHVDQGFGTFLHERGYKGFKLFTFSQLFFEKSAARFNSLLLWPARGRWYVSSVSEEFIMNFFSSLIQMPQIEIEGIFFPIEQINLLQEPNFEGCTEFLMLSPLVVSIPVDRNGKIYHKYLMPGDEKFESTLVKNLVKKYEAFYGEKIDAELSIEPDWDYIRRRERITKLIDIRGVKIKATVFPFKARGDSRLIKIGYEAGFGERNSLGFGMVACAIPETPVKKLFDSATG